MQTAIPPSSLSSEYRFAVDRIIGNIEPIFRFFHRTAGNRMKILRMNWWA
jgi:hypothetical protein